jgi:hypothetical protein
MFDNLKLQEGGEVGCKALYLTIIQIKIPTRVFSVFVVPFIAPLCRGLTSVSGGQGSVQALFAPAVQRPCSWDIEQTEACSRRR